jgi:hypothetical protein
MRRVLTVAGLALLAALLPMSAAHATARVAPALDLQLYLYNDANNKPDYARLVVTGTGCSPLKAPASVTITLSTLPGEVFTAKPNAQGRWSASLPIALPIDGVYVVNATCDDYFGQTPYPPAQTNADEVLVVVGQAGGGSGGSETPTPVPVDNEGGGCTTEACLASTGTDIESELGLGVVALLAGGLLVLIGRRPRPVRIGSGSYGRSVVRRHG